MRPIVFAAFALLSLSACSPIKEKGAAEAEVARFHALYDAGDAATIYDAAGAEFKKLMSKDEFDWMLHNVHRRLGNVRKADQKGWSVNYDNDGNIVTFDYTTDFTIAQGEEQFVYRMAGGKPVLAGYRVTSQALQMN